MTPIERLKEICHPAIENNYPYSAIATDDVLEIIHALENPWIKTSERLPKDEQEVNFKAVLNQGDKPVSLHGYYIANTGFVSDEGLAFSPEYAPRWHPLPKDPI